MEIQKRRPGSKLPMKLPMTRLEKGANDLIVWTTALGLPIVQPYRKTKRKQIWTSLQSVFISDPNSAAEGALICCVNICNVK